MMNLPPYAVYKATKSSPLKEPFVNPDMVEAIKHQEEWEEFVIAYRTRNKP